ncbi:MAG TPA: alpha/beta fold hydrolase [Casimicrobiaceae bacterium]|nr:alpha/beta fold hydrolase [Casimicrobiaceae bacterium]
MFSRPLIVAAVPLLAAVAAIAYAGKLTYPDTPMILVSETYHDITVSDPYRWLENDSAATVTDWLRAQNALTRRWLDALPAGAAVAERLAKLLQNEPVAHYGFQYRKQLFAFKRQPPRAQPLLVVMKSTAIVSSERTVLDPVALDPSGRTTIDFYRPSHDGRHVIVSLSKDGSEIGTAYVFDVATGKRLPDVVPGVTYPTGGGSVEWASDNRGFFYTRYPQGNERPAEDRHFFQQVWFHELGAPIANDRYVIGKEFPRIAETELRASEDGRYLLAAVANGDGGEFAYHLRAPDGRWTEVAGFKDDLKHVVFGDDGNLYALTVKDAPLGRILALPLARPSLANARVVVPEAAMPAESVLATRARLYVTYRIGGPSAVHFFALDGKRVGQIPAPMVSDTHVSTRLDNDDVLVRVASYVDAPSLARYETRRNRLVRTQLNGKPDFDLNDAVVTRELALSKDGTRVPLTIIQRKGAPQDGSQPLLLHGYGGYGVSMAPYFSPLTRFWLDWGGAYAVANVRGGGEYGEPWHLAGNLTKKQNVFDDFAACAQFLVDRKYTRPDKLAIIGGSNGGLLMGAMITQHPELFRAVVSQVGMYDALRWETQPNGAFNVTEFGTVKEADQFKALYAYSPYLNVRDGVAYPSVLLTGGDNDGRVAPYESRKMAARLQAASGSSHTVLLRTDAAAGHGIGTALANRIAEEADVYAFLVNELGMQAPPPATKRR